MADKPTKTDKVYWGSRLGVVLAVAGSAVGLGNFLRFPGQAAQNGGGAFMIPYFIVLLIVGIPLAWAEWTMGRHSGVRGFHSAPGIFAAICRNKWASLLGSLALLIPLMVYTYYVVIEAWCLGYAWNYLVGAIKPDSGLNLGDDPEKYQKFFDTFTGATGHGHALEFGRTSVLVFVGITFLLNFFLILGGVQRGIERFCKVAMPLMIICALCVLVRVLTLGSPDPNTEANVKLYRNLVSESDVPERHLWLATALFQDGKVDDARQAAKLGLERIKNPDVYVDGLNAVLESLGEVPEEKPEDETPEEAEMRDRRSKLKARIKHLTEELALEEGKRPDYSSFVQPLTDISDGKEPEYDNQSVEGGLNYMWNPDFDKLKEPRTWLAAAGQIFFSLSVGFGVIINYASYVRRREDIALSGLTAASTNEFFEVVLGGLITLPAAFIFLGVAAGSFSTFGLGFNALPNVFARMPGGQIFGFLWFFMLFLAAITSSLSMLQPVMSFIEEGLGMTRAGAAIILGLVAAAGSSFILYYTKGLGALDTVDFWVGTFLIVVLATIQSIVYGWIFGTERGQEELSEGALIRVPRLVQILLKFVTPVVLIGILLFTIIDQGGGYVEKLKSDPIASRSVYLILGVLAFILLMIVVAVIRWSKQGRFDWGKVE